MTVQTDIAAVEAAFSKLKAYVSEEVATAIHDLIVAIGIKQIAATQVVSATPAIASADAAALTLVPAPAAVPQPTTGA
jgi:hypothetical protein